MTASPIAEKAGRLTRFTRALHRLRPKGAVEVFGSVANRQKERELALCFSASSFDQDAARLATRFVDRYTQASPAEKRQWLSALAAVAEQFPPSGKDLASLLDGPRARFFKRCNAQPEGLPFLVALRADFLDHQAEIPGLEPLANDLGALFSAWFDVGFLDLRPISWDSPASLLEKLMRYEAVHAIRSWDDLRNRLDSDRLCYAFFHPRMPKEPLIFVEVALVSDLAGDVQHLLDVAAPVEDPDRARWAIFYSISNTQSGLRGVSFGNALLKRVISALTTARPKIEKFATLSPVPGFRNWLLKQPADVLAPVLGERVVRLLKAPDGASVAQWLTATEGDGEAREEAGRQLMARYLVRQIKNGKPLDVVARFHLGNGARVEQIHWRADPSDKGMQQSLGMMVNYRYVPEELDDNLARLARNEIRTSRAVARLL